MIIFYLGPDSLLPLGSILAAVAGFILLFWSRITGIFRRGRSPESQDAGEAPANETIEPDPPDRPGN